MAGKGKSGPKGVEEKKAEAAAEREKADAARDDGRDGIPSYILSPSTPEHYMRREAWVLRQRARRLRYVTIADLLGLGETTVRDIVKSAREKRSLTFDKIDASELVQDFVDSLEQAAEDYATIQMGAGNNDGLRLAAIGRRLEAEKDLLELVQDLGVLPKNMGDVYTLLDTQRMVAAILEVFEAFGIPEHVQLATVAAVEGKDWRNEFAGELSAVSASSDADGEAEEVGGPGAVPPLGGES